jgi:hypothetical protein
VAAGTRCARELELDDALSPPERIPAFHPGDGPKARRSSAPRRSRRPRTRYREFPLSGRERPRSPGPAALDQPVVGRAHVAGGFAKHGATVREHGQRVQAKLDRRPAQSLRPLQQNLASSSTRST